MEESLEPTTKRPRVEGSSTTTKPSERSSTTLWSVGSDAAPYSDWTIVVQSSQNNRNRKRTFSMHRVMIGPKSDYFDAMFKGNFAESQQSAGSAVTTLTFHDLVVEHFHVFLNYCYDQLAVFKSFSSPTELAVKVFLGDYFGVVGMEACRESLFQSLNADSDLVRIYNLADELQVPKLRSCLAEKCASDPKFLGKDSSMAKTIDVQFLIEVLEQMIKARDEKNGNERFQFIASWSEVVADFCHTHIATLEYDAFLCLTNEKYFPDIPPDLNAILKLLDTEKKLSKKTSASQSITCMTSLEKRCVEPVYAYLNNLGPIQTKNRQKLTSWVSHFRPQIAAALLQCSMKQASQPFTPLTDFTSLGEAGEMPSAKSERRLYHVRVDGFATVCYNGKAVVVAKKAAPSSEPDVGDIVVSANGVLFEEVRKKSDTDALMIKARMKSPGPIEYTFLADQAFKKRFVEVVLPSLRVPTNSSG